MFANILLLLTLAYCTQIIILAIATFMARYPSNALYRPSVTIIVAARNVEHNIRRCIESILQLSYPAELLEIVIVDDRSTDRTAEIVRDCVGQSNHMRLLTATQGTNNLRGKANAVAQGIEASRGDILLFTDADCTVPLHWVEEMVKYYSDPSVGVVAGFTVLRNHRLFEAIQTLDWLILFSVAAAVVRLGYPVTAVGNNLSVRRAAYDQTGGYPKIPFSVTEDYALFHAITRHTNYRACFPLDASSLVDSQPCKTLGELYQQKKRWFTGGRGMDAKSLTLFAVPFCMNAALLLSLISTPWEVILIAATAKMCVDLFLASSSLVSFGQWRLVKHFVAFEIYYTLYVLVFPIIVLFAKKVIWKERRFGD